MNKVILPSFSWRPAIAAIRPLIAAEPILRMPRPETVEDSIGAWALAPAAAAPRMTDARSVERRWARKWALHCWGRQFIWIGPREQPASRTGQGKHRRLPRQTR